MTVNNEMKIGHPYSNIFNIFLCPNHKPIQIVSVGIIGIVLSTLRTFLFILLKNQDFGKFLPLPHTKIFTYDLLCFS